MTPPESRARRFLYFFQTLQKDDMKKKTLSAGKRLVRPSRARRGALSISLKLLTAQGRLRKEND